MVKNQSKTRRGQSSQHKKKASRLQRRTIMEVIIFRHLVSGTSGYLSRFLVTFNPIPTGHGRNQPIYERHVTKSGRNRFKRLIGRI